jgi:hypothetical protein
MFKKVALILAVFALLVSAGTLPSGTHYRITLFEPTAVHGTVLQPGEYRLLLAGTQLTVIGENNKKLLEFTVKVETQDKKFDTTSIQLDTANGQETVTEIRLGGTKTRLVLN